MIDNGQTPGAIGIAELETSNPNRRFAIKKESTKRRWKSELELLRIDETDSVVLLVEE